LEEVNDIINFMNKPKTTLFMLMSVDGKISTGDTNEMDVDKDFPTIAGLKEGLYQYYDIEKTTDLYSLNTGKVFKKIGVNEKKVFQNGVPAYFVIIDNKPHLTPEGISYLSEKTKGIFIITTNNNHPALELSKDKENIKVFSYKDKIDFNDAFYRLKNEYGVEKMTIQSGGTLNSELVRAGLIDRVLLVVAPALIGGKNTTSLISGESLHTTNELDKIKTLELVQSTPLKNSYLLLEYIVKK